MRLSPDIRGAFNKLVKKGLAVKRVAELFDPTRQTVPRWLRRAKHVGREYFKDKPRKPKPAKITQDVELLVLLRSGVCRLLVYIVFFPNDFKFAQVLKRTRIT